MIADGIKDAIMSTRSLPVGYTISQITDQGSGALNEDVLLTQGETFALFDGASSLVPYKAVDGRTGGKLAADAACKAFSTELSDLQAAMRQANKAIHKAEVVAEIDHTQKESLWGTTVSIIRIQKEQIQYAKIGNSPMLVIHTDNSYQILGRDDNHDLETLLLWQSLAQKRIADPWESMRAQNIKIRRQVNETYGVLNGEQAALSFVQIGTLSLGNVKSIILLSDGLLLPKEDSRQAEQWDIWTAEYLAGGLPEVLKTVRAIETADPNAWTYPRLKKHDDASAIAIDFDRTFSEQKP
jgi:serine/threonine protein phosphatase PrpC